MNGYLYFSYSQLRLQTVAMLSSAQTRSSNTSLTPSSDRVKLIEALRSALVVLELVAAGHDQVPLRDNQTRRGVPKPSKPNVEKKGFS